MRTRKNSWRVEYFDRSSGHWCVSSWAPYLNKTIMMRDGLDRLTLRQAWSAMCWRASIRQLWYRCRNVATGEMLHFRDVQRIFGVAP